MQSLTRQQRMPIVLLFIILNGGLLASGGLLKKWGIDSSILIITNTVLFLITLLTLVLQAKALQNSNPNVFIRSVMSGMMIKMLIAVLGILLYYVLAGASFSRTVVFAAMGLYIVYLAVEVAIVSAMNRNKNG